MTIPRIVISQQFGALGINITPAKMHMSTHIRRMSELSIKTPEFKATGTEPPAFHFDFTKVMSDIGNKSPSRMARDYISKNRQRNLEIINQASKEGDFIGATELGGDRAIQSIKQKMAPRAKEFDIGLLPSESPPEIDWDKPSLKLNWSGNGIKIEWDSNYMPTLTVNPKVSVEVYLRNKPKITISVEEYSTDPANVSMYA